METFVQLIGYKEDLYNPAGWYTRDVVNYIEDLEGCAFVEKIWFEKSEDEFLLTEAYFEMSQDPYAEWPQAGIDYLIVGRVPILDDGYVVDEEIYAVSLTEVNSERIEKDKAMERLMPCPF